MRITKDITLGKFFPGNSFVHRLDPRTKIFSTIIILATVFAAQSWPGFALWGILIIVIYRTSGIPGAILIKNLRPFFFIFLFTFVWHIVFLPASGEVFFQVGSFKITGPAISTAIFYCLRIALFILFSSLLTLTTAPLELTDAIEITLAPLKKIKIPVHEFALMTAIAIRFIPTILDEAEKLYQAQSNRGAKFTGALNERLSALLALTVPLLTNTFQRAEDLALAMEARCYDNQAQRTNFNRLKWNLQDAVVLLIGCVLAIVVVSIDHLS
ncbi:MAG: energy-coupling factor transporter transmembrane protein EcfT [Calditrichaeota bacterium]|nr:MAG: energy-coupling factor transporter transmembrane protein EcfT [Calditrichota bacterium]